MRYTKLPIVIKRGTIIIKGFSDLLQMILMDMQPYAQQNSGYRYSLVELIIILSLYGLNDSKTKQPMFCATRLPKRQLYKKYIC